MGNVIGTDNKLGTSVLSQEINKILLNATMKTKNITDMPHNITRACCITSAGACPVRVKIQNITDAGDISSAKDGYTLKCLEPSLLISKTEDNNCVYSGNVLNGETLGTQKNFTFPQTNGECRVSDMCSKLNLAGQSKDANNKCDVPMQDFCDFMWDKYKTFPDDERKYYAISDCNCINSQIQRNPLLVENELSRHPELLDTKCVVTESGENDRYRSLVKPIQMRGEFSMTNCIQKIELQKTNVGGDVDINSNTFKQACGPGSVDAPTGEKIIPPDPIVSPAVIPAVIPVVSPAFIPAIPTLPKDVLITQLEDADKIIDSATATEEEKKEATDVINKNNDTLNTTYKDTLTEDEKTKITAIHNKVTPWYRKQAFTITSIVIGSVFFIIGIIMSIKGVLGFGIFMAIVGLAWLIIGALLFAKII